MRIAVIGAGGVGGYFGGRLAQAGEPVVFIARGAHLDAIRREGLHVQSVAGDFAVRPAEATDDPTTVEPVDVALVCVKAWQVAEAGRAILPLLRPDAMVVPLQNGVEAADELAAGSARGMGGAASASPRSGPSSRGRRACRSRRPTTSMRRSGRSSSSSPLSAASAP